MSEMRTIPPNIPQPKGGHPDFYERIQEYHKEVIRCSRCVFDVNTPYITFDDGGVCNYCHAVDALCEDYPNGKEGELILEQTVDEIKKSGKNKPFDLVIGVSGGCDSSYMIVKAKEWGLRPLAAHFDNTWNSTTATNNIHTILDKLNVELYTHVVDNEVFNDMCKAFIRSGVIDIETPTDLALATTLYQASAKYGLKHQFEGHSFRTEGIGPLGWFYMDGKYIESVVKQFGNYNHHKMKTYPNLTFAKFMKYTLFHKVKKIRPLYWMDYNKESVKEMLSKDWGWTWYGGHHLENRFTAFLHSYYAPRRFGLDTRVVGHSAMVRDGKMTRDEALAELTQPFHFDSEIVDIVKKRLGFSDEEFEKIMQEPTRTFRDFRTYKQRFERLRPLFYTLMKAQLVPKSFYLKYTSKECV